MVMYMIYNMVLNGEMVIYIVYNNNNSGQVTLFSYYTYYILTV